MTEELDVNYQQRNFGLQQEVVAGKDSSLCLSHPPVVYSFIEISDEDAERLRRAGLLHDRPSLPEPEHLEDLAHYNRIRRML
jgi:hypothetical protein